MKTEVVSTKDIKNLGPVFGQLSFQDHEQIVFCNDKDTGLKAIIGIHNTVMGPALGGTRMWNYANEWEALNDVLRLSRGMTYKSAITGLNLGGGKAVIIGDAKTQKTPELMRRLGQFVDSLSGKYITAEDVGMETKDMDTVNEVTKHVAGISVERGGSGNPSPVTAYGVFANGGYLKKPYLIEKMVDSHGQVIDQTNTMFQNEETPRVIDPRNAFIMTTLLQDVVNKGTAQKAKALGRSDIAGKTGTTNNQVDAWFAGYTPSQVAIAWIGFDQPKSLGKDETGSQAALPIWIKYMQTALKDVPIQNYEMPDGVMIRKIKSDTGTPANENEEGVNEYFYSEFPPHNEIHLLN